jgi:hypothetical protein
MRFPYRANHPRRVLQEYSGEVRAREVTTRHTRDSLPDRDKPLRLGTDPAGWQSQPFGHGHRADSLAILGGPTVSPEDDDRIRQSNPREESGRLRQVRFLTSHCGCGMVPSSLMFNAV